MGSEKPGPENQTRSKHDHRSKPFDERLLMYADAKGPFDHGPYQFIAKFKIAQASGKELSPPYYNGATTIPEALEKARQEIFNSFIFKSFESIRDGTWPENDLGNLVQALNGILAQLKPIVNTGILSWEDLKITEEEYTTLQNKLRKKTSEEFDKLTK